MKRQILCCATMILLAATSFSSLKAQENFSYNQANEWEYDTDYDCCDCEPEQECLPVLRNIFYLGPDIYHVKRLRRGGTHQSGVLCGVRGGYDRIKRYNFYVGVEGAWASGEITGESASGSHLKSTLTEAEIEGRLGYTLGTKHACRPTFTPFVGVGYFNQTNKFRAPSPVPLHFTDTFQYGVVGFLSNIYFMPCLSAGVNFKAKFVYDPRSRISNDPEGEDVTLKFGEKTQYEVDLPITFYFDFCDQCWTLSGVPFYIYRHYGEMPNFPFDFVETKYIIYGGRLLLGLQF